MTSTNRTLNLTSPPLCAQTAQFVTHHWTSLTLYCPLVLVAGGVGCSGMHLAAGPPAKACDWMQGMLWPSSPQVLVSSLQHTAPHLLQHTHTHTGRTPHIPIINPTRALNEEMIATRIFGIATDAGELGQHNQYSAGELE